MDGHQSKPFALNLQSATIRELLVELEKVGWERERDDCHRLRSRERMLTAELSRRRQAFSPEAGSSEGLEQSFGPGDPAPSRN